MAENDDVLAHIDKVFTRAIEILREDKILSHLRANGPQPELEPPADPALPRAPKPKEVPAETVVPKHWWFGETS